MTRFWEHLFANLPYWATFSPGRKLLRVPKLMEAHFTRIHFFCEILIGLPVRIRQACASPHQIVIWICFWLIDWDGNAARWLNNKIMNMSSHRVRECRLRTFYVFLIFATDSFMSEILCEWFINESVQMRVGSASTFLSHHPRSLWEGGKC